MAVVTPLNNFLGPEGDTVTVDEQLLNTEYQSSNLAVQNGFISLGSSELPQLFRVAELGGSEYKFWSFCKPLIVFKVRSFKQKAVFRAPSKFPIW